MQERSSDAEAVALIAQDPKMDPRAHPDLVLGAVKSLHRGRWAESTQLCALGSRVLVHHRSRRRTFLGGLFSLEFRNGRIFELVILRGSPCQVKIEFGS